MGYRIGYGEDIHAFKEGDFFPLAGVMIPGRAVIAHSDGDVIYHALMDALLGAASLGDIGELFPDDDARYAGISSSLLVKEVYRLVKEKGFALANVDIHLLLERPKILPYKKKMKENICSLLSLEADRVSLKAGTNEGFDSVGEGRAVKAIVSLLLEDKDGKPESH